MVEVQVNNNNNNNNSIQTNYQPHELANPAKLKRPKTLVSPKQVSLTPQKNRII